MTIKTKMLILAAFIVLFIVTIVPTAIYLEFNSEIDGWGYYRVALRTREYPSLMAPTQVALKKGWISKWDKIWLDGKYQSELTREAKTKIREAK